MVAAGVKICTAFAAPSGKGATVMPSPPIIFGRLYAIFAASTFGMISRLASCDSIVPGRGLADHFRQRRVSMHFTVDFERRRAFRN